MRKLGITPKSMSAAVVVAALAMLGLTSVASAYSGEYARFNYCPSTNPEVSRCIFSQTTGGVSVLGNAPLPLVNPVTIQGGFTEENEEGISKFVAATNGVTLSKSPQPVPGGLLGVLAAGHPGAINNPLIRRLAESSINRLYATIELARPASAIRISLGHLSEGQGVGLAMPVKIRLENPLLGSSCQIGSAATPILLNLTAGTTSPPPPNQPIKGGLGELELLEEGSLLKLTGMTLVDNAWSAPRAEHCGGILAPLIDPIINRQLGLPSPAGRNTVAMVNTAYEAPAVVVNNAP